MSLGIALIGAGSAVFTRTLLVDLLLSDLEDLDLRLVDPDQKRLSRVQAMAEALARRLPQKTLRVRSLPLAEALRGSQVAILTADVGGDEALQRDYQVALRHGVDQTIGDTLGPGGLMKFLRNAPLVDEVAERFEGRMVLNYMNPLSPLTALLWARGVEALGLCHSIPETAKTLARYLEIPAEELSYQAAGVNHLSWFLELRRGGEDLYPRLRALAEGPLWREDPVRFELLRYFGLFPSESSAHASEYVPYFRKGQEAVHRYFAPGGPGDSGYYAKTHPGFVRQNAAYLESEALREPLERSGEYAVPLLEGLFLSQEVALYATLRNQGELPQLLPGPVELPVVGQGGKLRPVPTDLPPGPATLSRRAQEVHALFVHGYVDQDPSLLLQALALDPLTGALLDLRQVEALFRDLIRHSPSPLPRFLYAHA
ncbi:glycosyl hydrolase family 4 [Thermus tenuipuniceus]|uniref:family 4 glycosyl hydrolase n=1 Tax=Thermus tenuipuniceus TaxID=2078690 RepID=UPI000CF91E0E|nr:glycosyl hydrolase family 4 [Thermus tenuipuniceus]